MNKNNVIVGIVFIAIGLVGVLGHFFNLDFLRPAQLWPLAVLIPGICLELSYFTSGKNPGLLVPGGILTVLGLLFFFETSTDWYFSGYTWPVYILAPAVGLFQLFLFSKPRTPALLIPVGILTLVGGISFANIFMGNVWNLLFRSSLTWPIIFVLIGVVILFTRSNRDHE